MTREEALKLVQEVVQEPVLVRHMQAVAAIARNATATVRTAAIAAQ